MLNLKSEHAKITVNVRGITGHQKEKGIVIWPIRLWCPPSVWGKSVCVTSPPTGGRSQIIHLHHCHDKDKKRI